jgi:hypothetical protein
MTARASHWFVFCVCGVVDAYFEAMKLTVNDKVVELVQESNVMPDVAGICGVMLIARLAHHMYNAIICEAVALPWI